MRSPRLHLLLLAALAAATLASARPSAAAGGLTLTETPAGVVVRWSPGGDAEEWPAQPYGGALVPMRLVSVYPGGGAAAVAGVRAESRPWSGGAAAPPPAVPQPLGGEPRPDLAAPAAAALPPAPILVLRESRGPAGRVAVLAVSRYFDAGQGPRELTALEALAPGASLAPAPADTGPARSVAPAAPGPTNPALARAVARLTVARAGLQRVTGAALAAAGVDAAALAPASLQVFHAGQEWAAEVVGGGDGRLDPADELRFYAASPGDRWNATDTYWLVAGAAPGLRIAQGRDVSPGAAPLSPFALERGRWRAGVIYDTTLAGPIGDHWFAADLRTAPGGPAEAAATAPLTASLPLATGQVSFTLTLRGAAYTTATRTVEARAGGATASVTWGGTGSWSSTVVLTGTAPAAATVALLRGVSPSGVELQAVDFVLPVTLSAPGGAAFEGRPGAWRYQVLSSPAGRQLYDVTDPRLPQRLTAPAGASFTFQDGQAGGARRYLLSGPSVTFDPAVARYQPADLAAPLDADALYITPAALAPGLAPLLALRAAQGYTPRSVDVQAIYDAWSDGQVDPRAIRAFLRYARDTWAKKPVGVTLVGDGTSDPLDYVGRHNVNFIPPYLADVDPWLRETACETCYAQLDGDDPLSDSLPDVQLGRLPAKSLAELQAVVAKIVGYETGPAGPDWQSRAVIAADNYREPDGTKDTAGDFAAFADALAAQYPAGVQVGRLYYDPWPGRPADPWREPDGPTARLRLLSLVDSGAALVTYVGHSSQFQWAVTGLSDDPSYLLGMYDADLMKNTGSLAVFLELTCLTGAFQTPSFSGTSIDERLLLQPGGAVAVWGSSGLAVAHGHDALARGFSAKLWSGGGPKTVGELAQAGYEEVFTGQSASQDVLRTFLVLGDPLTRVRAAEARRVFLPLVAR